MGIFSWKIENHEKLHKFVGYRKENEKAQKCQKVVRGLINSEMMCTWVPRKEKCFLGNRKKAFSHTAMKQRCGYVKVIDWIDFMTAC